MPFLCLYLCPTVFFFCPHFSFPWIINKGDLREYLEERKPPTQKFLDEHFPILEVDFDQLRNPPSDSIQCTWIGHATLLVQMGGCNILTDPIFSDRCSAFQFIGPKRHTPPATTIRQLHTEGITIDTVLVSHNHYDHLDYNRFIFDNLTLLDLCFSAQFCV